MSVADCSDCQVFSVLRADPSGTKTLREKYAAKLRGQYAAINTDIRTAVRDEDLFGLESDALATPNRNFTFNSDPQKVEAFMEWLNEQLEAGVLEVVDDAENQYIRKAYERGVKDGRREVSSGGSIESDEIFDTGVHRARVQQLFTRNFQALRDINDEMAAQISEVLSQGLVEGIGPDEMARNLTDRVDKIGKTRATVMARTETLRSHAEGKLDAYQREGISQVVGKAEVSTAQDRRVCAECQSHHGQRYTIEQARGILPLHPQCRCVWMPVTPASNSAS